MMTAWLDGLLAFASVGLICVGVVGVLAAVDASWCARHDRPDVVMDEYDPRVMLVLAAFALTTGTLLPWCSA